MTGFGWAKALRRQCAREGGHRHRHVYEIAAYVQRTIDPTNDQEIVEGLHFFKRIGEIVDGFE